MSNRRVPVSLPIHSHPCEEGNVLMATEKITVRATHNGQSFEVTVFNKRVDNIQVVLGEGVHSVRCDLTPTRNGSAYVGNAMGREIVYERSREDVKGDLARAAGFREFRR